MSRKLLNGVKEELGKVGGPVVHPEHYNACGEKGEDGSVAFEPIKVIEAWGWGEGFCYGNAIKYILRAPHKGSERADLEKARWYLNRLCEAPRPPGPHASPHSCHPMQVALAWRLPGRLQRAIEYIAVGSHHRAVEEVSKYLDEMEE